MARSVPPSSRIPLPNRDIITGKGRSLLAVRLAVVTPLFGGSAIAGEPDADLPVRAASVRGNLRFWWRACNAARFRTARELFNEEARIWGASALKDEERYGP